MAWCGDLETTVTISVYLPWTPLDSLDSSVLQMYFGTILVCLGFAAQLQIGTYG